MRSIAAQLHNSDDNVTAPTTASGRRITGRLTERRFDIFPSPSINETPQIPERLRWSGSLPAPSSGVLLEQKYSAGTTVKVGDVIGTVKEGAAPPPKPVEAKPVESKPAAVIQPSPPSPATSQQ